MSLLDAENAKRVAARNALYVPFSVETNGLNWMVVHGLMCLGLRHPQYKGPSRTLGLNFVRALGQRLVEHRILTAEELAEVERLEQEESPHHE